MAHRWLTSLLPLAGLVLAATACQPAEDDDPDQARDTTPPALITEDSSMAWSATIDENWDVTDAVASDDVLLVATKWELEEDSTVTGYDAEGTLLWEQGPGYGTFELTVLDDGSVQACDDFSGEILDPATGDVVRDATAEECPEEAFDGADTTADDVYDVVGPELVVYDDAKLSEEQFRIALEDRDAVAWGVDGGVVTYSEAKHQVRLYR